MSPNEKINVFEKSIDRISEFIYNLLKLAKLETSEGDFKKDKINLSKTLNELIEYFSVLAQEQNINIKSRIEPGTIIMGQKDKLEELVTNLVSNSFKYMPESGKREVVIKLIKAGGKARLIIEDTGIGISKKDLPNIFKRFYRIKKDNHNIQGTGLGLAICKKIIEKHNGIIKAESEPGKGAKFTINFPLYNGDSQ
jgi:signal transduction histidine kinase